MLRAFVAQSEKGALAKKPWLSAAGKVVIGEPQTDPSSPFFIAHWNHQMEVGLPLQILDSVDRGRPAVDLLYPATSTSPKMAK
jgi:hypothetical protein